jgi:hypothetical protein
MLDDARNTIFDQGPARIQRAQQGQNDIQIDGWKAGGVGRADGGGGGCGGEVQGGEDGGYEEGARGGDPGGNGGGGAGPSGR